MARQTDPKPVGNILIVDDVPDNLRLLSTTLSQQGYRVRCAKNGSMALMGARNDLPDLILLDINMPDLNGYQVCQQLKADSVTSSIPVIFLSAQDDVDDKVKAFAIGAADFIGKPFQVEEVLVRVKNQLTLQSAQIEIQALQQEIVQRDRALAQLRHDAFHDPLTGLPNRNLFMEQVSHCLQQATSDRSYQFAILFIDLDRLKMIDDSLGHLIGDQLLVACSQRLAECIDEKIVLTRLGGDEFTILLPEITGVGEAVAIAEKILDRFTISFEVSNRSLLITVSIGIVLGNGSYQQEIDLLSHADMALHRAKELGKSRYEIFERQMYLDAMSRLQLENELRQGINQSELVLFYQPIFAFNSQELIGFEALVRWQHPIKGMIAPEQFISLAEETGLIVPLGAWVMKQACQQLKSWQEHFPQLDFLTMSINVAGEQLYHPNFLSQLDCILAQTQVDSQRLKFEIVESMLMEDTKQAIAVLNQIKKRNIRLSIDDFGTGYSSLSYLPQFPLDILKIDRSFVEPMNQAQQNLEIIKAIITLAQVLELQIIAEGIENQAQFDTLQSLGVDFAQGFWLGKPLTAQLATDLIAKQI